MTIIACLEAVALVAIAWLLLRHQAVSERAWTAERRELLTRIQRPDIMPLTNRESFVIPEQEDDELHLVGTIADPPLEERG